ncbi:MAG: hypothetical protein ACRD5L_06225, partial [Bryobacteraceae bacterium]
MSSRHTSGQAALPTNAPARPAGQRRALAGILVRRECWTLSSPAKLVLVAAAAIAMLAAARFIHPFLATTNRVHGQYLVVEGWVPT